MNLTVPIPDDLAQRLSAAGGDLSRRALEALALEEYGAGRLTKPELRRMLGYETRAELDGFLKMRGVAKGLTAEEFDRQVQDLRLHSATDDLVARFQTFAAGHTLGGLDIKDLISEGRR
jgi:Uncharacterised protein family (UPF0175)